MARQSELSLIDVHTHIGVDLQFYLAGHHPYALDWPTLGDMTARNGIGRVVVFPMPSYFGLERLGNSLPGLQMQFSTPLIPYAFENRRLAKELARHADGPVAALPFWMVDPARACDAQIEALRSLKAEFPCFGLKIQGTIIRSKISELLQQGRGFLDLAAEWNVPVLIHTSVHPEDEWSQAVDILEVVRSRPEVRFILAHSCRFDRACLDEAAALPNAWLDCSAHGIHCVLATDDNPAVASIDQRFPSDYRDPAQVLADLAAAYPDKLCWGSDAPFDSYLDDEFALRGGYDAEIAYLKKLDAASVDRIARKNPLAVLGISS